jgi:hypothetical protein
VPKPKAKTFLGKPCRRCGATERYARCKRCVTCQNAQGKEWRKANLERDRETRRAYREANQERMKATTKAWNAANPERVKELGKSNHLNRKYGLTLDA